MILNFIHISKVSERKPSQSDPEIPEFEALSNIIEQSVKKMVLR